MTFEYIPHGRTLAEEAMRAARAYVAKKQNIEALVKGESGVLLPICPACGAGGPFRMGEASSYVMLINSPIKCRCGETYECILKVGESLKTEISMRYNVSDDLARRIADFLRTTPAPIVPDPDERLALIDRQVEEQFGIGGMIKDIWRDNPWLRSVPANIVCGVIAGLIVNALNS